MAKIVRLTESDLTRIVKRVIMERKTTHQYHLFSEKLQEIEKELKKKNMTDEDLDEIREELEEEKKMIRDEDNRLSDSEKKTLNNKINSLISKLNGMKNF